MTPKPEIMTIAQARRLFLAGQDLLNDPGRAVDAGAALAQIQRLGFVQLDSINIVERAHHHILWARMHGYRPDMLDQLQGSGAVFEHWTHDAAVIPSEWFPHWRQRFARVEWGAWLRRRLGARPRRMLDSVIERIRREGPLQTRDFEHAGRKSGPWWDWKPAKAALEYWWRRGELAISRRVRFEKVYDLTERVLPNVHKLPITPRAEHTEWVCRAAMDRLGFATPRELAYFFGLITQEQAAVWCRRAAAKGVIVPVHLEGVPAGRAGYAPADWQERLAHTSEPPSGMRLLSPFDPLVHDRARCQRLFGFDYRFEAFVPEPKRRYGYYVLPILQGDRLVGRLDPKLDRETSTLVVRRVWWEPTVSPAKALGRELKGALERYAALMGVQNVRVETKSGAENTTRRAAGLVNVPYGTGSVRTTPGSRNT